MSQYSFSTEREQINTFSLTLAQWKANTLDTN